MEVGSDRCSSFLRLVPEIWRAYRCLRAKLSISAILSLSIALMLSLLLPVFWQVFSWTIGTERDLKNRFVGYLHRAKSVGQEEIKVVRTGEGRYLRSSSRDIYRSMGPLEAYILSWPITPHSNQTPLQRWRSIKFVIVFFFYNHGRCEKVWLHVSVMLSELRIAHFPFVPAQAEVKGIAEYRYHSVRSTLLQVGLVMGLVALLGQCTSDSLGVSNV